MTREYFEGIDELAWLGPQDTSDALGYRYYEPTRRVLGKPMAEQLRMAVCYWHTLCWTGDDTFGSGSFGRPWHAAGDPLELAHMKLQAGFELFTKLGLPFFTFHDRDVAPEGETPQHSLELFQRMVEPLGLAMEDSGVRLLWGTANLFGHPRYAAGAATNPDPEVFACAALQVRAALEATCALGGDNYVLWGGREGYDSLVNTDMKRELDQLGRFLALVVEHKHKLGFGGQLLIEPKPMEPTKHQYDFDCAAVYAFLQRYDLEREVRVNIEVNHATLAGHSFQHELSYALANGIFGSVDANRGDPQLGWDTDQFPNSVEELTPALYTLVQGGGLGQGGFNFDAKLRRQSVDPTDLLHAHAGAADTLALALLRAEQLVQSEVLARAVAERYADWDGPLGRAILAGELSLAALAERASHESLDPSPRSGQQERLENRITRLLHSQR